MLPSQHVSQWAWFDSDASQWRAFSAGDATAFDAARNSGLSTCNFSSPGGQRYALDFDNMLQVNLRTGYVRAVRDGPPQPPPVRGPMTWVWADDHNGYSPFPSAVDAQIEAAAVAVDGLQLRWNGTARSDDDQRPLCMARTHDEQRGRRNQRTTEQLLPATGIKVVPGSTMGLKKHSKRILPP